MLGVVLARLVEWVLELWLLALVGLVVVQLVRGRIITTGLLTGRKSMRPTAGRIQLLLTTIVFAAGYAGAALAQHGATTLPDIPAAMLAALLGSHGFYLGGKYRGEPRGGRKI